VGKKDYRCEEREPDENKLNRGGGGEGKAPFFHPRGGEDGGKGEARIKLSVQKGGRTLRMKGKKKKFRKKQGKRNMRKRPC